MEGGALIRRGQLLLSIILIAVLASCSSVRTRTFSEEETKEAFDLLSSDMMGYIASSEGISGEDVVSILPRSFIDYAAYVPLYDSMAGAYGERVAEIISPLIPQAYPLIEGAMAGISGSYPVSLISDDTAFTDAIEEAVGEDVRNLYLAALSDVSEQLDEAFQPVLEEFSSIRRAYSNLSAVGGGIFIAAPMPASDDSIADLLASSLFSSLSDAERSLKNRPLADSSSPYGIFWGGAF